LMASAPQLPTTPVKAEPASGAPSTPISAEDALRAILAQAGASGAPPSLPAGFFGGAGAGPFPGAPPAGLPFPFLMQQNDLKPEMLQAIAAAAATGAPGGGPMMPFMDFGGFHPYGMDGVRRKNATRETTAPLKSWLSEHRKNPYPTKADKVMLAYVTKMTLTQVSTWFANARRRLKKENKMTWSPRNRAGEDDDDFADLERPGSSKSDLSDDHNESNNNENNITPEVPEDSPRKPKTIWSIADTVGVKEEEATSSSKREPVSPSAATNGCGGGASSNDPNAAAAMAMAAAFQQQFMARHMLAMQQMLMAGGAGAAPGSPAAQAMMQARLAVGPGALNGVAGIPVSSLSPSSSTHSSDADKPPTLTSEDVVDDELVKKETPETPESN
ncbi:hypothetical protein PFISCL1PPCAC_22359, partial [Pristionchus fissidentatus]